MNLGELRKTFPELAAEESLSADERALLRCGLARRFEGAGDYEEARELLSPFWPYADQRPQVEALGHQAAAELLLRAGVLTGWMSGDQWEGRPQETAKDLITESLFLFERLGLPERAAEARAELSTAYWREGAFEEARALLAEALELLGDGSDEMRAIVLLRQALAEALTTRGTALARLGRFEEARKAFARAAAAAEESGGKEVAGLALLTMLEELCERLPASEMVDCYKRADELLLRSQEPDILARLRRAARRALEAAAATPERAARHANLAADGATTYGASRVQKLFGDFLERESKRVTFTPEVVELASRLFAGEDSQSFLALIEETAESAPDGAVISAEAVEVVALRRLPPRGNFAKPWEGFSLKEELREPEKRFIELALKAADGKISVAARLLGLNHNEILTSIIKSRYPELLASRLPPIPRKRSIMRKPRS